jgi:hypothetical protein
MSEFINTVAEKKNQKLIDLGPNEKWNDFLEEANKMFLEEKILR